MTTAIAARKNKNMYQYDTKSLAKFLVGDETPYHVSYLMLEKLKSFATDINLMSWIAHHQGAPKAQQKAVKLMNSLPLVHCIDQHVWPDFVYYCRPRTFKIAENHSDFGASFLRFGIEFRE